MTPERPQPADKHAAELLRAWLEAVNEHLDPTIVAYLQDKATERYRERAMRSREGR